MTDTCPHRSMPLSQGKLIGDTLQCAYHGLEFDTQGRCTKIPGQANVPPRCRVRTYPLVEKWRWIWLWMGDPEAADPAEIPDFHLERRSGMDADRRPFPYRVQLRPSCGQSPGPVARNIRASDNHRQCGRRRNPGAHGIRRGGSARAAPDQRPARTAALCQAQGFHRRYRPHPEHHLDAADQHRGSNRDPCRPAPTIRTWCWNTGF